MFLLQQEPRGAPGDGQRSERPFPGFEHSVPVMMILFQLYVFDPLLVCSSDLKTTSIVSIDLVGSDI